MKYFCPSSVREKSNVGKPVLMKEPETPLPVASTCEDHNSACLIVKDASGLAVAYVTRKNQADALPPI
jgi:hypothetical protein